MISNTSLILVVTKQNAYNNTSKKSNMSANKGYARNQLI